MIRTFKRAGDAKWRPTEARGMVTPPGLLLQLPSGGGEKLRIELLGEDRLEIPGGPLLAVDHRILANRLPHNVQRVPGEPDDLPGDIARLVAEQVGDQRSDPVRAVARNAPGPVVGLGHSRP